MNDLVREANPAALRQNPHQLLLNFLRRLAFGKSQSARDAEDVRIHHHAFSLSVRDAKNDVGRLARRAGKCD